MCRSRRELSNEYLVEKIGFDTAENELCKVCPLSAYGSPRFECGEEVTPAAMLTMMVYTTTSDCGMMNPEAPVEVTVVPVPTAPTMSCREDKFAPGNSIQGAHCDMGGGGGYLG